jgi:hypothetical protein
MRNKIIAIAILAFAATSVNAQDSKPTTVSIGLNVGIPTGTFSSVYSIAYGADLQADFSVAPTTKITASAGYQNFAVKSDLGGGNSGFIPVLGGAKFYFGGGKAYGHAQLGYGFATEKGADGAFAYAPSIGYYLSPNIDASLKYLSFSFSGATISSLNLRVAYNF